MAIASPAVPGAAEAVKQSGRKDVGVTGLGLPNASKPYLMDGVLDSAVLWNTKDLGYLTVHVATALAKGTPRSPARRRSRPAASASSRSAATTSSSARRSRSPRRTSAASISETDPALHEGTESMSVQPLPRWDDAATAGMSEAGAAPLPLEPARLRPPHHQLRRRQHLGQDPAARSADRRAGRGAVGEGLGRRHRQHEDGRLRDALPRQAARAEAALSRPRPRGRDGRRTSRTAPST